MIKKSVQLDVPLTELLGSINRIFVAAATKLEGEVKADPKELQLERKELQLERKELDLLRESVRKETEIKKRCDALTKLEEAFSADGEALLDGLQSVIRDLRGY